MIRSRPWIVVLASAALVALSACGGGGQGLRTDADPLLVTSTSLPAMLSGEIMDHVIPLQGGCGGPYVLQVIEGRMPHGVVLDDAAHALRGALLEDGTFAFTIQITDTGCEPFSSTRARFQLPVGIGDIQVVGALRDGNPVLIPVGGTSHNPDYPSIGVSVYNDYATIEMIVAGGKGPYDATLFDAPDIPNDGPLPLGVSVPPGSTSLNGAPVQVGPNGAPFLITLQITDSIGAKGYFTFYWLIETPPIVFATDHWADGQAGVSYGQGIFVAEGVPPFDYEFVAEGLPPDYTSDKADNPGLDPSTNVIYNPGAPPTVTPAGALVKIDATYYPPSSVATTIDGVPPEGAALDEESGTFSGIPRRYGDFVVYAHVKSTLVPNSFGQHAWGTLEFSMAPAPPIVQSPAYTLDPAFTNTVPYARLVDANRGEIYNPDGGPAGLQLLATGGVPDDGNTDAPHVSQYATDPAETPGSYKWTIDWNPDGDFDGTASLGAIPGMELLSRGVFRIVQVGGVTQVDALTPQPSQTLAFTATDSALPDTLALPATEKVSFGVGPDRILVTSSSTAQTSGTDNRNWDDSEMTLRYVNKNGSAWVARNPVDDDLTGDGVDKHVLPPEVGTGTTLADLLTSVDLLRVSVNPTGYWDDRAHLNPNAARPYQNSHTASYYMYYGPYGVGTTSYSSGTYTYGYQPATSCVRLPNCQDETVAADKAQGVYTDGGKLHVFDTATHFGVFIVRQDGKLYIPAAFKRGSSPAGSGYYSFGDNWTYGWRTSSTTHSATRMPQMTVSPDGRIAAFKLRTYSSYSQYEYAYLTDILLISLTGERIPAWGDEVYKIIQSGSPSASTSTGLYLYASSLTLTNDHLYYIIGNQTTYAYYRDHYIYRYSLFGGNADNGEGAFLQPSTTLAGWTNTAGSPMAMPFQYFGRSFAYDTTTGAPDPQMFTANGYNCHEGSLAPHPFRVSRNGRACAMLAGTNYTGTDPSSAALLHHVWLDYEGSLRKLSTIARHTSGGGRGYALQCGPTYGEAVAMWGTYSGPTSRFEISDDGLKVAVVYYRNPTVDPYVTYTENVERYREDVSAYVLNDPGGTESVTVHEVTGDGSSNTGYDSSYVLGNFRHSSTTTDVCYRFGALTFTVEGDGLVFWGGASQYDPGTYYHAYSGAYTSAKSFMGSLFSYDFAGLKVRNLVAAADGGCISGSYQPGDSPTYFQFSDSWPWSTTGTAPMGVIQPVGGFRSKDGNFLYIATFGAVSRASGRQRAGALIGVNVRSVNASGLSDVGHTINGRMDGRAFYVEGFGPQNGFLSCHYYHMGEGVGVYSYSSPYPNYYTTWGFNDRVAAADNGWVYFTSVTANSSQYPTTAAPSASYGGPYYSTYGYGYYYYADQLYVFDPNLGGDVYEIGGAAWTGPGYQDVSGLVVSDDGTSLIEVGCTYASTPNYPQYENLTVFSGIALDPETGVLPTGSVTLQKFASSTYVGDCAAFGPTAGAVYYAAGTSSTSMSLMSGDVGGNMANGVDMGLPGSRWSVLHAGR